jgi:hypothetical protein
MQKDLNLAGGNGRRISGNMLQVINHTQTDKPLSLHSVLPSLSGPSLTHFSFYPSKAWYPIFKLMVTSMVKMELED